MKTTPYIPLEEVEAAVAEKIAEECQAGNVRHTLAGCPETNRLIGFGLEIGNLGVISGGKGAAKTTYGQQLLRWNAEMAEFGELGGFPTRMASFDLPYSELERRFLRALAFRRFCVVSEDTELQRNHLQSDVLSSAEFTESFQILLSKLSRLDAAYKRFGIWDLSTAIDGLDELARIENSYLSENADTKKPKVIVVDSLKGIERLARERQGTWTAKQRMEYLLEFTSRLKDFAMRWQCAIWLVIDTGGNTSQGARQGLAFDPLTREIREIASAWIGLGPVQRHPDNDRIVVTCERENGGDPSSTVLYVDFDTQHFRSHPTELNFPVDPAHPEDT